MPKLTLTISKDAKELLTKVGGQLRAARQRREQTIDVVAAGLNTTPARIRRAEAGDPGVGIGVYAMLLKRYGLQQQLLSLAAPSNDPTAQALLTAVRPRVRARAREPARRRHE